MRARISPRAPWRWLAVLSVVCAFACSTGDGLSPVEGKVVFKSEPIKGVVVTFHPKDGDPIKAIRPVGQTKEDGTFTLLTGDKPGAPAGEYVVTFVWPREVAAPKGKKTFSTELPDTRDAFDGAFADANKSTFKVAVKKGANKLDPFYLK